MQAALARAKLRLEKGRTTFLGDSSNLCSGDESGQRSNAQNALTLISDYGMESDEEDEEDEMLSKKSYQSGSVGDQQTLGAEDPLANFFDELQHEGLLEEQQQQGNQGPSGMPELIETTC